MDAFLAAKKTEHASFNCACGRCDTGVLLLFFTAAFLKPTAFSLAQVNLRLWTLAARGYLLIFLLLFDRRRSFRPKNNDKDNCRNNAPAGNDAIKDVLGYPDSIEVHDDSIPIANQIS